MLPGSFTVAAVAGIPIRERDGHLVGLITPENVAELVAIRTAAR